MKNVTHYRRKILNESLEISLKYIDSIMWNKMYFYSNNFNIISSIKFSLD